MAIQSEYAETKTVRLSKHLAVEMTAGPGGFTCEWIPDVPRSLSKSERRAYRAARDELLARMGERLGRPVFVIEV